MEEAREAWSRLEVVLGTPREAEGTPAWPLPPPREWCAWRDLGRLAKRPSAIILNSGKTNTHRSDTCSIQNIHNVQNVTIHDTQKMSQSNRCPSLTRTITGHHTEIH